MVLLSSNDSITKSYLDFSTSPDVSTVRTDSELVREIYTSRSLVYLRFMARILPMGLVGSA